MWSADDSVGCSVFAWMAVWYDGSWVRVDIYIYTLCSLLSVSFFFFFAHCDCCAHGYRGLVGMERERKVLGSAFIEKSDVNEFLSSIITITLC